LIDEYMKRDYPETYNDKDYVYLSQLTQAKGITMGIEAHRRSRPYNMGSLYWQLNDCWPVISWSSIDYFGNWKALHYKVKKSFDNLLISSTLNDNIVKTYIVNDYLQSISDTLHLKIIDFEGNELWSKKKSITAYENSSTLVSEFSLEEMIVNPEEVVLVSTFQKKTSTFYLVKPKDLKLLKHKTTKFTFNKVNDGFTITLSSPVLLKDVFLGSKEKGKFSDNFFDLLPQEEKTIFFKTDSKSIPQIDVRTLNMINNINHAKNDSYKTDSK